MPKALRLKPGDRVVIDLEAAQQHPQTRCLACGQTRTEDERRVLLRSFAEGEWVVGADKGKNLAVCRYCHDIRYTPDDYIQLIATFPVKQGNLAIRNWAVPRSIVSLPLPLEP